MYQYIAIQTEYIKGTTMKIHILAHIKFVELCDTYFDHSVHVSIHGNMLMYPGK